MILETIVLVLAAIPAALFLWNLLLFRRLRQEPENRPSVSVLIPARNEEASIRASVESALASRNVELEVIVLDDHSSDQTAAIVSEIARRDNRLRLERAPDLPVGWCGKQHACHHLSLLARYPLLCFLDADVRLQPDCLARMAASMDACGISLLSGFPRQITATLGEKLLIPLIHFILLGFLPMILSRKTRWEAFAAGCGQLMMARADAYKATGGHAAIRESLHDGIRLPRAFRKRGFITDAFDASDLAACRMYAGIRQVWFGLAKNATEGMAGPASIFVFTTLLAGGQLAPWLLLINQESRMPALVAIGCSYLPRFVAAARFRQSWLGAALHPVGIAILLAIQWYARWRAWSGRPAQWKDRSYAATLSP